MTRTGLQGFLYYITPNFEGLTVQRFLQILLDAISQLFFSLVVSMGIKITYGSYVKKKRESGQGRNVCRRTLFHHGDFRDAHIMYLGSRVHRGQLLDRMDYISNSVMMFVLFLQSTGILS